MAQGWGKDEVDLTIDTYFSMLRAELDGEGYSKAAFRKSLISQIDRSEGAVEYKFQNVSAVLAEIGAVFIDGYKPARNVQGLLRERVVSRFDDDSDLRQHMLRAVEAPATAVPSGLSDPDPVPQITPRNEEEIQGRTRLGRHPDYQRIEALNRALGHAGEQAVVNRERRMLASKGRRDLADRVRHVAALDGDGLGYDVLSFAPDGVERFLEVKTTRYSSYQPFLVTRNEVDFSSEEPERFALVRLFRFEKTQRGFYELPGSLTDTSDLEATVYSGLPRAAG